MIFTNTQWLHRGLDYFWMGRTQCSAPISSLGFAYEERVLKMDWSHQTSINASDIWCGEKDHEFGEYEKGDFCCPDKIKITRAIGEDEVRLCKAISLYSREPQSCIVVRTKLPELKYDGQAIWFGFEDDYSLGAGGAMFQYTRENGRPVLRVQYGQMFKHYPQIVNGSMDFTTEPHIFAIYRDKDVFSFYIDRMRVANRSHVQKVPLLPALLEIIGEGHEVHWKLNPTEVRVL